MTTPQPPLPDQEASHTVDENQTSQAQERSGTFQADDAASQGNLPPVEQVSAFLDLSLDRARALEQFTHGLMTPLLDLLREREAAIERKDALIWQQAERIGRLERELELLHPLLRQAATPGQQVEVPGLVEPPTDTYTVSLPEPLLFAPSAAPPPSADLSDTPRDTKDVEWPERTSEPAAGEQMAGRSLHGQAEEPSAESRQLADQMVRLREELQTIAAALAGLSLEDAGASHSGQAEPPDTTVQANALPEPPLPQPQDAEVSFQQDATAASGSADQPASSVEPENERDSEIADTADTADTAVTPEEFAGLFPTSGRSGLTLEPLGTGDEDLSEDESSTDDNRSSHGRIQELRHVTPSPIDPPTEPAAPAVATTPESTYTNATAGTSDAIAMAEAAVRELQRALNAAETRDRALERDQVEEGGALQRDRHDEAPHDAAAHRSEAGPSESPRQRRWFW